MNKSSYTITIPILLLLFFMMTAIGSDPAYAQAASMKLNQIVQGGEEVPPPEVGLPTLPQMPGRLEGVGTHFQLNNSEYVNVRVDSSEPIRLLLESVPEMVTMHIESTTAATWATIALGGFSPSTTYHKYEDDYHNHVAFVTDASGAYTYTQDLSGPHLIFIQPRESTKFIKDNPTGGNCTQIGNWDAPTKTCTLTVDLAETIQIDNNGITLDGATHTITGTGTGNGVYLSGRTGVTIKNLKVTKFSNGIYIYSSSSNTLTGNTANSNRNYGIYLYSNSNTLTGNTANYNRNYGIVLSSSSSNTFTGNTANSNYAGIALYSSSSNMLNGNTVNSNNRCGIELSYSSMNTLTGNTANYNSNYGIVLSSSSSNTLTGNTANSNYERGIELSYSSSNTLTGNTASNNQHGIFLYSSSNTNTLTGNTANSNYQRGIYLYSSSSNTLTRNSVNFNNQYGIYLYSSSNNKVYNNNFVGNPTQAYVTGGSGNVFNQSKPVGGNYWNNYDAPAEGCSDANSDGFCDAPCVFTGGQDVLPWIRMNGWLDSTPPTTTITLSGTAGSNGWYMSDVEVALTATDESGSGVAKTEHSFDNIIWNLYSSPFTVNMEGTTTVYYRSTDMVGNVESTKSQEIKIDKTAPTITGAATTSPNTNDWYNTDVTVHFDASDAISGLASVTSDTTLASEGAGQSVTGTATDQAGNTASCAVGGINIDKTPPAIAGSRTPLANANGWNNVAVTVSFVCSDGLSGLASCSDSVTLSGEGAGQSVTGVALDLADNSASATVGDINIDKTPPTVTASKSPDPNANGWNNGDVTVSFVCADQAELSGVASCSSPVTVTSEGADQPVTGTAVDKAGNEASTTASVSIDKTAPTISGAATASPNAAGWYKTDVTVHWTCADVSGSGVASCSPDASLTSEGAGQSASGSVSDLAGNSASTIYSNINIDKTPPTISGGAATPPNGNGWYNASVVIHFAANDGLSGLDTVTSDQTLSMEGEDQSVIGTATDKAGNSASATVSGINIDLTAPVIAGSRSPLANANGWNNESVTVSFSCSDALSGIASCSLPVVLGGEGAGQSVTGFASDLAGNSASATVDNINIDLTPPTVTGSADRMPDHDGWYSRPVTFTFAGEDILSGVDSCSVITYSGPDSASAVATGSCVDKAGNIAVGSLGPFQYDSTRPTITVNTPSINVVYVLNAAVASDYACADATSGPTSCVGPVPSGANIDTATVGTRSFTVNAEDAAGNPATLTIAYSVQYASGGLCLGEPSHAILQPINAEGSSIFKQGRTVPVKFRACDANGSSIGTPGVVISFKLVRKVMGTSSLTVNEDVASTTPDTAFRWDPSAQQWIFNIASKNLQAGYTYYYEITLNDGTKIQFSFGLR